MAKYRLRVGGGGSSDPAILDRNAASAKRRGFDVIGLSCLAEHTQDQIGDGSDSWVKFTAGCPGIMKLVETDLVNGVLSRAHIEKNAALITEQSSVVARHGMRGAIGLLEPMWLPGWFYKEHPGIRGARCDNPCLSLARYYSPCVDNPEVLAHYRQAVRKLLELAPALGVIYIGTNDSGAGICWCSGLYPGPNGNAQCQNIPMGTRVGKWLSAMLAGAKDAGKTIEIAFVPVHFSRPETFDTVARLPKHAHICVGSGNFPNIPFVTTDARRVIQEANRLKKGVALGIDPTLVGWLMEPATEVPAPYFMLDVWREIGAMKADIISVGGIGDDVYGTDTIPTAAMLAGFKRPPKSNAQIDAVVSRIARKHVGPKLAPVLVSAWRDVDHALRLWPNNADTNHHLYPKYSVIADRWLVRPLVPAPHLLSDEDKAYFSTHRHRGRMLTKDQVDSFFIAESTQNYEIPEMKWLVAIYDEMMDYTSRAVRDMEAALPAIADETLRKRFKLQLDRIMVTRAIWRTQRNVLRCGSTIEFFTGPRKEQYWHVIRKDESFLEPPTYRRLFLEAVDDEIANCRDMIRLMAESEVTLISTGDEQSFVLPKNLPQLLENKIRLMEAHKKDIDVLFPNCLPETFADPTYTWADKTTADGQNTRPAR